MSSDKNILTASIHYNNIEQTLEYLQKVNPKKSLYSNDLFVYNAFELVFMKGSVNMIDKVSSLKEFKSIVPLETYSNKNKIIYNSVGDFYIQTVISRICNGLELTRYNIGLWVKIFARLISYGFMSPTSLLKSYRFISNSGIPKLLKSVILIIISINREKRLKVVSDVFHPGTDIIIGNYM